MTTFTGCGTALVTPFRKDQSLDEQTLRTLVRRQIQAGINFLVPCGTTGESPTLTHAEHLRVVEITLEEAKGKVPVLAGAGGYNTAEVVALAKELQKMGADGILSVTPYYNKPTQEGLVQHFKAIASAVSLPIVVYSIQGRTGVNVEPATLKRLAEIENIVGVKEASGNVAQMATILHYLPERFSVFSGDDAITIPLIALGGRGVISVVAERNSGGICQADAARYSRRFRRSTRPPAAMVRADGSEFLRSESRAGESRDGHDGFTGAGIPLAHGFAVGGQPRENRSRAQVHRPAGCYPELACRLKSKICSIIRRPPITRIISCCLRVSRRRLIQARCARPNPIVLENRLAR